MVAVKLMKAGSYDAVKAEGWDHEGTYPMSSQTLGYFQFLQQSADVAYAMFDEKGIRVSDKRIAIWVMEHKV